MRAIIYNQIREALQNLAEVRHIDLFNEQVLYSEEEQPFYTPAVFVEFATIDWKHELHGVREAIVTVRLHVVTDTREGRWEDSISRLLLCDKINQRLHGLHAIIPRAEAIERNLSASQNPGTHQVDRLCSVMNDLTICRSITDHNFGELSDDIEEYNCHITDVGAYNRF